MVITEMNHALYTELLMKKKTFETKVGKIIVDHKNWRF